MELFKLRNEFNIYLGVFVRYKMSWGCLRFINRESFERKSLRLNAILIAFKWKAIIFSAELASMSFRILLLIIQLLQTNLFVK